MVTNNASIDRDQVQDWDFDQPGLEDEDERIFLNQLKSRMSRVRAVTPGLKFGKDGNLNTADVDPKMDFRTFGHMTTHLSKNRQFKSDILEHEYRRMREDREWESVLLPHPRSQAYSPMPVWTGLNEEYDEYEVPSETP